MKILAYYVSHSKSLTAKIMFFNSRAVMLYFTISIHEKIPFKLSLAKSRF